MIIFSPRLCGGLTLNMDINAAKIYAMVLLRLWKETRSNRGLLNYQSPDFMGEQIIEDYEENPDEFGRLLCKSRKMHLIAIRHMVLCLLN